MTPLISKTMNELSIAYKEKNAELNGLSLNCAEAQSAEDHFMAGFIACYELLGRCFEILKLSNRTKP